MVVSKPIVMVTVPGTEGDFGVLAGHAPVITSVKPGVIDIYEQDENAITERVFVAGGFAEVTAERCTVLAEEAVLVSALDRGSLETQARNLGEDINLAKSDDERQTLEEKLSVVRAKISATHQ